MNDAINQVQTDFGRIDACLANAGMGGSGPINEMTDEAWRKTNSVNYDSVCEFMRIPRVVCANIDRVYKFIALVL